MYVQVIKGRTTDPDAMLRRSETWAKEVQPGAPGCLGRTFGLADDGTFVTFLRFENEASANANRERPEQAAWLEETAKILDGEPSFRESGDVSTLFDGGSNDAGFIQVMEGSVTDRAKVESLETADLLAELRAARPDLIGSLRVWFDGNTFVEAAYFTSEEDARKGEASAGDFSGPQEEYAKFFGEMTFVDLRRLQLS